MQYKLILTDLDGTLVPELGMPPKPITFSKNILNAFAKARKIVVISICTGRDKETVLEASQKLRLVSLHIIEGGAKIIDSNGNTLWVKYISRKSLNIVLDAIVETQKRYSVIVDGTEIMDKVPERKLDKITAALVYDMQNKEVVKLKNMLSECIDIDCAINSDRSSNNTVYIKHREGTKRHGIEKLLQILKIKKEETIGVGDGENDIVLLKSCGLKVAMGNAVIKLKEISDYVAPSVTDDGLVDVIEKFIPSRN